MDISSEKKNLRKKIRRLIESMPEKKRTEESDECCQKIIGSSDFKNADAVLCYMATENEINTDMICTRAIREKKNPRTSENHSGNKPHGLSRD